MLGRAADADLAGQARGGDLPPRRVRADRLSRHSAALRLLQYVRDEAHRFAQHYHHMLRTKKTLGDGGVRLSFGWTKRMDRRMTSPADWRNPINSRPRGRLPNSSIRPAYGQAEPI